MGIGTGLAGMIATFFCWLFAAITASVLASLFTICLAAANLIIVWPKLKERFKSILNKYKSTKDGRE